MKKLRNIMREGFLVTVRRTATVSEACRAMADRNVGIVAVLEGDRLAGLFSERDVVRRVVDKGLDPARTAVQDVMTTDLIVANADDDYQSAMAKMDKANIRHLPVVSEGRLRSMISIRDLMRVELRDKHEELRYLHEYLYHVPPDVAQQQ
ncbi:MAG TPA: CBS domain-containing protein [Chloroflexota bacterium]|nr:CBS domain-containing protein [Chloroflexota bacterium]